LEDGFSFTVTAYFTHIILGFPHGPKPVATNPTKEGLEFICSILQEESPTIEQLLSLLTSEVDDITFKVTFMVLIVNVFIAPNGSGFVNPSYHENFRDVNTVNQLDWCSFSLECLMTAIKKHLNNKLQGILEEIQGCKILLVVRIL
jgi:hypothetical protein